MISRKRFSLSAILAIGLIIAHVGASQAAVTTVALYHLGEDGDNPAVSLEAAVGTDATKAGGGSGTIVTGASGASGSTEYLQVSGSFGDGGGATWNVGPISPYTFADGSFNWGMSAWMNLPSALIDNGQNNGAISNGGGYGGHNAIAFWNSNPRTFTNGTDGEVYMQLGPQHYDTWIHVAMVFNGSNNHEFYLNGVLQPSPRAENAMIGTDNQNDQATQFSIGRWNWDSTYIGGLDEVHVFSFAEGQFNINDVYQIAAAETVPEPSTFVLGGIGLVGLGLVAWRKRRCRC